MNMEYIDNDPDPTWPWTIFDAREGFVVDRAMDKGSAYFAYGPDSDYPDPVVILRTA